MSERTYINLGVSSEKEGTKEAIKQEYKDEIFKGAFCKIVEDYMGDNDYCSIMHADGVGSKSILTYLYYKETGNIELFKGLAQDAMVMNLDDLFCVGAINNFFISNTIARNLHRISSEILQQVIVGHKEFINEMSKYDIHMKSCGGEIEDNGDLVSVLTENLTFFTRLKKKDVINCENIKEGNIIVGLSSTGKACYETKEYSGIASNGLTAARHALLSKCYADNFPETYSKTIKYDDIYMGKYRLTDKLPYSDLSVGEALTSPCRVYAPILKEIIEKYSSDINGIINCTGKGQTKCKGFGQNLHYIKDNLFETPPLFRAIKESNNLLEKELFQIFNMGHMIELYCNPNIANNIIEISKKYNVDAKVVGKVEKSYDANKVTIKYEDKEFIY